MSALLAWPFALAFTIVAGCGGRASEPRATPGDASSNAGPELKQRRRGYVKADLEAHTFTFEPGEDREYD
jgi:hypothetical protein